MSEKRRLIEQMLAMQKKFIDHEHNSAFDPKDYYHPESDSPLAGYRDEYTALANKVIDMAHQEKGSRR